MSVGGVDRRLAMNRARGSLPCRAIALGRKVVTMFRLFATAALVVSFWALLPPAAAQANHCLAYVQGTPGVVPVKLSTNQAADAVRITYVDHSTFRLRTPAGVVIATDYAGYAGDGPVPTVATMNHAHETHYTDFPDPEIAQVLRGWNPMGGPAVHDLKIADVQIRNVPTDIRLWGDMAEAFGNSIFIFEVAELCIGHLGHLHYKLNPEQLALIGRLDIVFAAVDGSYTLAIPSMIEVLQDLRASLVIPMHYFGGESLGAFLAGMRENFVIEIERGATIDVSRKTLPRRPTVRVLVPYY